MEQTAGLVKLGEGREAEMFALDDSRVLRLYRGGFLRASIEEQTQTMIAVRGAGVRVPQVFEMTEMDGRLGVVIERIPGTDLLTIIGRKPWLVWRVGRVTGKAHAAIGDVVAPAGIESLHDRYRRRISEFPGIPSHMAEAGLAQLDELPRGDRLLHGDFHPGNVMMKDGEAVILDWSNAASGPPEADFARSTMTLSIGEPPPGTGAIIRFLAKYARQLLLSSYAGNYRRSRKVDDELLARWRLPVAVARLAEGIEEERERVLKYIDGLLAER